MSFHIRNKHGQFIFSFWLSFAVLLILNLFIWLYLIQIRDQFIEELKSKLLNTNTLISRIIDEDKINNIIPQEHTSIEYLYYQQIIEEIRVQSNLQTIQILSSIGELLVSAPESKTSAASTTALFKDTAKGVPRVSEIESYASQKFMSAYMPLIDINGFVSAIIVIEAKAEFFDVLDNLKTRILLLTAINLIAILLIAFFLSRMVKRSIQYQTELKERHHLAQIGTMAATVAHELRNPLAIIEATNDIIKKKYAHNKDELFTYISDEVKRLDILIDDFLKLTKTPKLYIEKIIVDRFLDKVRLSLTVEDINILVIEPLTIKDFYSDKNILEQVILNIIKNSFQSFKENNDANNKVTISIKEKSNQLNISIADTGCGISEENLKKIFNPFFSTKEQGTGLGLSVSKRLIELLGGRINITSKEGQGTEVLIQLPIRHKDYEYAV